MNFKHLLGCDTIRVLIISAVAVKALFTIMYRLNGMTSRHTAIIRACSHESGTVNYPGASVTSRSHDDLLSQGNVAPGQLQCPGASSSKSDHYEFI